MPAKFKLYDTSFYPDSSSSKFFESKNIVWDRGPGSNPVTFFTDLCFEIAPSVKDTFKVAWLIEPYVVNSQTYSYIANGGYQNFDLVLSHNKDFIKFLREQKQAKAEWYPFGGCWIPDNDWSSFTDKTKNLSIIASEKNWAPGHILRHKVIQSCRDKMDIFGRGYNPVESKKDALVNHRYSLAIENCRSRGYFTEKLIDCFATRTVPIYWGDPDIADIFDTDGIILCENDGQVPAAVTYVNTVGEDLYKTEKMQAAIQKNFEIAKKYVVAEDRIYEDILPVYRIGEI